MQASSLRRHLLTLCEAGFVRVRSDNAKTRFQPDRECPAFAELQGIIVKLAGHSQGRETILVVEDQPATAQITRILLESWGYRVLEANAAPQAIELFEQEGGAVQLLLTDVLLPCMSGRTLAGELKGRKPDLRVVLMSGYPDSVLDGATFAFLPKPFNPSSLSRMVRRELDRPGDARHMRAT